MSQGTHTAPCDTGTGGTLTAFSTFSQTRSTGSFRGTAVAGVNLDLGFGVISVGGFFTYDTAVAGFRGPTSTNANAASGAVLTPASIIFRGEYAYGGGAALRVLLY